MKDFILGIFIISFVKSDQNGGTCTLVSSCDEWSPCCNTAGWCGATYGFCGSGCYESGNFNSTKCLPKPACAAGKMKLSSDRIVNDADFKGDYLAQDFTVEGDYSIDGDAVVLKLEKAGTGVTLRSTRYINFGRVSADLTMARVGGVVTSFITMSDTKDEVDFEWVGRDETQTNWYYKGMMPDYNSTHLKILDLPTTTHNYAIDLTPDQITWLVDGKPMRTLARADSEFPSTPTRFSFSIWDGSSGSEGTRQWAGGMVDWNDDIMKTDNFFSLRVSNIQVQCYGTPTSKDSDFDMDPDYGLILKHQKPVASPDPSKPRSSSSSSPSSRNSFNIIPNKATPILTYSSFLLILSIVTLLF